MTKCDFDKRERFGIRKFTIGACSVLIGATLFGTQVSADQLENVDSLSEPAVELSSVVNEHVEKIEAEEGMSPIFSRRESGDRRVEWRSICIR